MVHFQVCPEAELLQERCKIECLVTFIHQFRSIGVVPVQPPIMHRSNSVYLPLRNNYFNKYDDSSTRYLYYCYVISKQYTLKAKGLLIKSV